MLSKEPSLNQEMLGRGIPEAEQVKVTVSLMLATVLEGYSIILVGSENGFFVQHNKWKLVGSCHRMDGES